MKLQPLLILIALEIAARLLSPYRAVPPASEAVSNPANRRGWPEYVGGSGDAQVIVISNSQAQGLDTPNPADRWVAKLGLPLRVQNWSSEGVLTGELEVLTAQAMQRKPALLVYVLGINNFDRAAQVTFARAGSDIGVLAGAPSLWPDLQGTLLWKNAQTHDLLLRSLYANSALVRSRFPIEDYLALHTSRDTQKAWFGRVLDLRGGNPRVVPRPKAEVISEAHALESRVVPEEDGMADLLAQIKRTKPSNTRVLWVWMPVQLASIEPRLYRDASDSYAHQGAPLAAIGARVADLTIAFDDREFQTQFHFNNAGHEHMANEMRQLVIDALR